MKRLTAIFLLLAVGLTACGSPKPINHDPRHGNVRVDNTIVKHCDGANLIYKSYGGGYFGGSSHIFVIVNSPDCRRLP